MRIPQIQGLRIPQRNGQNLMILAANLRFGSYIANYANSLYKGNLCSTLYAAFTQPGRAVAYQISVATDIITRSRNLECRTLNLCKISKTL